MALALKPCPKGQAATQQSAEDHNLILYTWARGMALPVGTDLLELGLDSVPLLRQLLLPLPRPSRCLGQAGLSCRLGLDRSHLLIAAISALPSPPPWNTSAPLAAAVLATTRPATQHRRCPAQQPPEGCCVATCRVKTSGPT